MKRRRSATALLAFVLVAVIGVALSWPQIVQATDARQSVDPGDETSLSFSDAISWQDAIALYRSHLDLESKSDPAFVGLAFRPASHRVDLYGTTPPGAGLAALIADAPAGTDVRWVLVKNDLSDLLAAQEVASRRSDLVNSVGVLDDFSGVVLIPFPGAESSQVIELASSLEVPCQILWDSDVYVGL